MRKIICLSLVLTMLLMLIDCTTYTKTIKHTQNVGTEVIIPIVTARIDTGTVKALDVFVQDDTAGGNGIINLTDMLVGIYLDDAYCFTVTYAVAEELLTYLENKRINSNNLGEEKQLTASYNKAISVKHLNTTIDKKYVLDFESAKQRLEQQQLVYKRYTITPTDTLQSISETLSITEDEVKLLTATYNDIALTDLWAQHDLIVGTQLQYPVIEPVLKMCYMDEEIVEEETMPDVEVINDETLVQGTVQVVDPGVMGKYFVTYTVMRDENGEVMKRTELGRVCVREPKKSIVRVGTKEYYTAVQGKRSQFSGTYYYPIQSDQAYISAYVGDNRGHKGIDIAAPYATPIYAICDGTVTDVGTGWNGGYGNAVVIQNTDGNIARYAHMSWVNTELNATVKKGDIIGYVGSTGNSTGNHLHLEVIHDGLYYNPLDYF